MFDLIYYCALVDFVVFIKEIKERDLIGLDHTPSGF